ncbi:MAG TPA: zinc metalloprotease HtpX [Vicinamibacterales bacterium]|nr:zinc metalloprotease HtpX [Vicinamibacterales bacterium]
MNGLKTAALLGALAALFMLVGSAFGESGLLFAFIFAVVTNGVAYWFSDRIVLRMHNAQEVNSDHVLYRMTQRLTQKAGLPMPRVYIIPSPSPNAFATGRDPDHAAVAATQGILNMLSESELEGVIAHELTHVKNRDTLISTIAATIAAAIMFMVQMGRFGLIFGGGGRDNDRGGNPIALLATLILAPIAAMLIQATISRGREYAADAGGATMAGTPMGLAMALRKIDAGAHQIPLDTNPAAAHLFIVSPFWGGMGNLFATHPPTEARVKALMEMRGRL